MRTIGRCLFLLLVSLSPAFALEDTGTLTNEWGTEIAAPAAAGEENPAVTAAAATEEASAPIPAERPSKTVQVIASALNVRTSNRAIVCTVPRGTELEALGRHADGQRIQVRIHQPGCPEYGYVDSDYVTGDLMVDATNLNFRSQPRKAKNTWRCSLNEGSHLNVLGDRQKVGGITWIKVRLTNPKDGCPDTGYVARSYLKSSTFKDLPVISSTIGDCIDCNRGGGRAPGTSEAGGALQNFSNDMGAKITDEIDDKYSEKSSNARIQKLVKAARAAAEKPRLLAPHVCKRLGRKYPCGKRSGASRSKGWCKAGVREAFEQSFGYSLPGGSALASKNFLEKHMTRLAGVKCENAPVGAVCLYTATYHNFGHIEIKTGKHSYCSDFCAAVPITSSRKGGKSHHAVAVYMP